MPEPSTAVRDRHTPEFWAVRDWVFSLSLANICFFRTWAALLERRHTVPTAFIMAIVNVLLMAVCLRVGYFVVQRTRSRIVRWIGIFVFAGLVLLPFHALTTVNFPGDVRMRNIIYMIALAVGAMIVVSQRVRHGIMTLTLVLAPFVLVTFGQALTRISNYDPAHWQPPTAPTTGTPRMPRLVWLLFDEWDYGPSFAARRPDLQLPEVDRIIAESFHATRAHPPEASTAKSVPRLITGDMTATTENMSTRSNVFSRAKESGLRSAAVAWYIDYCGAFGESMEACWTTAVDAERGSMGTTAREMAANQLKNIFENQFRSPFGQPIGAKRHVVDYRFVLQAAREAAASPGYDFVYVHFPIPHEPLFYDSSTGRYDLGEKPIIGFFQKHFMKYLDALQLADQSLGQVRRAMEASGVWENTHLLLTSDHVYRQRRRIDGVWNDNRVPFIVRVAGASETAAYDGDFNTVLAPDLVIALLRGEVRTPNQVRDWVQAHGGKQSQ